MAKNPTTKKTPSKPWLEVGLIAYLTFIEVFLKCMFLNQIS